MTIRVGWEDQYVIAYQSTSISNDDNADTGVFVGAGPPATPGITGTANGLLLDEKPMLNPGVEHTYTEKTTGIAQNRTGTGFEYRIGRKIPNASIGAMGLTPHKLAVFGWLLFQKGASENTYVKTFVPPASGEADCEVWGSISKSMGIISDADGLAIHGLICTQIGISGAEGERYIMSAELLGRNFISTYDHTASDFTTEVTADHMFFDYSWKLANTDLTGLQSFDLTIVNNASARLYDNQVPGSFVLGRIGASGTFKLAMSNATVGDNTQLDNFIAGTDVLLLGTHTDSKIIISVNCKYTGDPSVDPAEEELIDLPYEGAYDGTNNAVELTADDGITREIN